MKKHRHGTKHYEGVVLEEDYGHVIIECPRGGGGSPRRYTVLFGPVAAERQNGRLFFTNEGQPKPGEGVKVIVRVRRGRVVSWTTKKEIRHLSTSDAPHPYRSKHHNSRPPREPASGYGGRGRTSYGSGLFRYRY